MLQKEERYRLIKPTEKQLAFMHSWKNKRNSPFWKFLLLHGIFKECFFLFIVIKIIQFFYENQAFTFFYLSIEGLIFLFFEILFWIFAGFIIGWIKYNSNEIEYELLKGITA